MDFNPARGLGSDLRDFKMQMTKVGRPVQRNASMFLFLALIASTQLCFLGSQP